MPRTKEELDKIAKEAADVYITGVSMTDVCKQFRIDKKIVRREIESRGLRTRSIAEQNQIKFGIFRATQREDGTWHKICRECRLEKPVERFQPIADYADKRGPVCYDCINEKRRPWDNERYRTDPDYRAKCIANSHKRYHDNPEPMKVIHKKHKYNLTMEEFLEKLDQQGYRCAGCGTDNPGVKGKTWCVDHDHDCCSDKYKTCGNCIRGLLCHPCNFILGLAKDNQDTLLGLIEYLKKYPKKSIASAITGQEEVGAVGLRGPDPLIAEPIRTQNCVLGI